jgi:hypothetical protein
MQIGEDLNFKLVTPKDRDGVVKINTPGQTK